MIECFCYVEEYIIESDSEQEYRKIYNTMKDVDRQTDELLHSWKEPERRPNIVEEGVFGDEGWSIEISNPIVERGTSATSTGMVTGSDASGLQEDEGDQGTS